MSSGRVSGSSDEGSTWSSSTGDSANAQRIARQMFTDMMSSAGVGHNRMAIEVLFFMPKQFADQYSRMFHAALQADAGAARKGERDRQVGDLGRAAGSNTESWGAGGRDSKGGSGSDEQMQVRAVNHAKSGSKGGGHWHMNDERASALKSKIDRRLRRMAREISDLLDQYDEDGK